MLWHISKSLILIGPPCMVRFTIKGRYNMAASRAEQCVSLRGTKEAVAKVSGWSSRRAFLHKDLRRSHLTSRVRSV